MNSLSSCWNKKAMYYDSLHFIEHFRGYMHTQGGSWCDLCNMLVIHAGGMNWSVLEWVWFWVPRSLQDENTSAHNIYLIEDYAETNQLSCSLWCIGYKIKYCLWVSNDSKNYPKAKYLRCYEFPPLEQVTSLMMSLCGVHKY